MSTQYDRSSNAYEQEESKPENGFSHSDEGLENDHKLSNGFSPEESRLLSTVKETKAIVASKKRQNEKLFLLHWFYKLPIQQKLLIALFTSELFTVVGLLIAGGLLLINSGRSQLFEQAKAEIAITETAYNEKINQMGFGFRGQSDNAAIIAAASAHDLGNPIPGELEAQVERILKNEQKARNIEYATLVGRDLKIIVNANIKRKGETFNPNNLVQEVLKDPRQIKASAIISWPEIQKESPVLPEGFAEQDSLIRYTVTPVKEPQTNQIIGALVSGDLVNGKTTIPESTLKAFGGGYSAIYFAQNDGSFILATSLNQPEGTTLKQAQKNLELPDQVLVQKAFAYQGERVTERLTIGGQNYTVAAQALPSKYKQGASATETVPNTEYLTILVRGTPETTFNQLLINSLLLQVVVATIIAIAAAVLLAYIAGSALSTPIQELELSTKKFAKGDRHSRAEVFANDEVGQLAITFNQLADNITKSESILERQTKQAELLAQIATARDRLALESPLNQMLVEIRQTINADRVLIYRIHPNGMGYVEFEAILPQLKSAKGEQITDACIPEELLEAYSRGRVVPINDIYNANLHPDHFNLLEGLQVKSNLVLPIITNEELYGLLIAHHTQSPHQWQNSEIDYLTGLSKQLGVALSSLILLEQRQQETEIERQRNEELQRELFQLLSDVEEASQGDLTVRAEISASEIGIVADFFNSIVENLREIVTQVKQAATQVNSSVGDNETAISHLAEDALKQTNQITQTLNSVEQMTFSIQEVARNAQAAAEVARKASTTAQTGGRAMERTVESIIKLRETISETAKKVKRLGESSQQISKVISLINQIAMQTNLLAINASIEAARAGEEGRGFAVVAEEVGQLAEQSASATKEVEQIVQSIQLETSEVAEAMEIGTAQVVEGTNLVEETMESLGQIVEVSRQIDQLVQSISQTTVSQAQTSKIVTNLMQEIAKVSQRTSDSSRRVSNSLRQTVEITKQLQESVGAFKVGTST
jgi:twitching motility protein PilJ